MSVVDVLRQQVRSYLQNQQYGTACYWADKLVCLGKSNPKDVLLYAQALYHDRQYHRAISLIFNQKNYKDSLTCRYFIAQCHYACSEYVQALEILDDPNSTQLCPSNLNVSALVNGLLSKKSTSFFHTQTDKHHEVDEYFDKFNPEFNSNQFQSSVALLKGKLHEIMENRSVAVQFYTEALTHDIGCYEAFEKLVHLQSLSAEDESQLLCELDFDGHPDAQMAKLVKFLYKDKLNKATAEVIVPNDGVYTMIPVFVKKIDEIHSNKENSQVPEEFEELNSNSDVIINWAGQLLDMCRFQECYELTSRLLHLDPFNPSCLPIHISVLKELDKSNELFKFSHNLMNVYPSNALSWFSVGCYYLCIQKNELARRHLLKASQLDRRFGPTWLVLGHAFAADGEHDQAISSYCTAAQVIKGSHIPITYIGMEYSASNNRNLAERFLNQAYLLSPNDPFVLHEMGTLAFESQKYVDATGYLTRAYDRVCELSGQIPSSFWEPLVNNLAHAYRKLGVHDQAISMYELALRLVPDSPTTLASLAMIYAVQGKLELAVDYLHRSVGVQPAGSNSTANNVAATMLSLCIQLLVGKKAYNLDTGKAATNSPQKQLPAAGPKSLPGSELIRFKKPTDQMKLDVYLTKQTSSRQTNSSVLTDDDDVSMELN